MSLETDGGGDLVLLPRLQQIVVSGDAGNDFDAFIDSRRIAGRPVNLCVAVDVFLATSTSLFGPAEAKGLRVHVFDSSHGY